MSTITTEELASDEAGSETPEAPTERWATLHGGLRTAVLVASGVVIVAGVVLRFWTQSALWLDEALTVNISAQPLRHIPHLLRHDGAPPLYYFMLHFWIRAFGNSDDAVRALSGLISVATLPVAWFAAKRFAGRTAGWIIVLFLASSPFAVFYATEPRMYSLVMFLTACGILALSRALERPRPWNLVAVAVVTSALLYTHYWAFYLLGALAVWLLFQMVWGRREWRRPSRWIFGALVVGCLTFIPWIPTFIYQTKHTGTPWGGTPTYAAIINAITSFSDNQASLVLTGSNQGRLLALGYFALAGLAVFGVARGRWHVDLDVRTRPLARGLAFVTILTLVVAITGGILSKSAFSPRYAAVVFMPILVMMAIGAMTLADMKVRVGVVAVVVAAGMASSIPNIYTQRTQARQVSDVLAQRAHAGDVVAFCPDQLGPAVYRMVPSGHFQMIAFPRGNSPEFVNWVNYSRAVDRGNPVTFAARLKQMAGTHHEIWLVNTPGYPRFIDKCESIATSLAETNGWSAREWLVPDPGNFYQPMGLIQFAKTS